MRESLSEALYELLGTQPWGGHGFLSHLWADAMLLKAGGLYVEREAQGHWFSMCKSSSHWELCADPWELRPELAISISSHYCLRVAQEPR